jgi:hypothetical protein
MDSRKSGIVIVVLIVVAIAAGVVLFVSKGNIESVATTKPTTRLSTTRASALTKSKPKKTVEMSEWVSPAEIKPSADARIAGLINAYNKSQDSIVAALLHGQCTWEVDGPGKPREMVIHFERARESGSMVCGPESCVFERGKVHQNVDSWINIDSLYLIMFRKYDGNQFKMSTDSMDEGKIVAVSDQERLTFDAESGRLVESAVKTPAGEVIVKFVDFANVGGITMPTVVGVKVPKKLYPGKVNSDGNATFSMDVGKSKVTTAP